MQLLTADGDARIALDTVSGLNAYGCPPYPDPELLDFASSTASVISTAGYHYAEQRRERLLVKLGSQSPAQVYASEMAHVRRELLHLCELPDPTQVIFSPSGTDVHSIAAQYVGSGATLPARIVMIEANETGRGVTAALDGSRLAENSGRYAPEAISVSVRLDDGLLRSPADIDKEVASLVNTAVAVGQRVLLILIDQSKTGLIAPSPRCVMALHHQFQDNLDVLVDACQFRIAPPTLHAYLQQGFMIALTGSKFLTGPSFSAALLLSKKTAKQLQQRPFPVALIPSSNRANWPLNWAMPAGIAQTANFGLLFRWEIALQELRLFRELPQTVIIRFLHAFAMTIKLRLNDDPLFEPLPVIKLDRQPLIAANNWDQLQTIFPFLLYHADVERTPLSAEETLQIYRQLPVNLHECVATPIAALRCQLGQPVVCGENNSVSALRLCVSARLMVKAIADNDNGTTVINDALAVLDKTARLIRSLPKPD